ncbi:unnamed protein product [Thelazia callipaeda]|uniref:ShKT domain-containing protein n=1 Tax=Thelazia callipaeda TaxID=103827 RepID=A0A0N5D427_THECL|nr:unnamed protein product [Thelazia callipaeda]
MNDLQDNLAKDEKNNKKYEQPKKFAKAKQTMRPIIKLRNRNFQLENEFDQQIFPSQQWHSKNSSILTSNKSGWQYSGILSTLQGNVKSRHLKNKINILGLKKVKEQETVSVLNKKKEWLEDLNDYFKFWNLSENSSDAMAINPLDISRILTSNKICSLLENSTLCCEEIIKKTLNFTNIDEKQLKTLEKQSKCRKFCTDFDLETGYLNNLTENFCSENSAASAFLSVNKSQVIIFKKTTERNTEPHRNSSFFEFELRLEHTIQSLSKALNTKALQKQTNGNASLYYLIEFSKVIEIEAEQRLAMQLLQNYQHQYIRKTFSNLIQVCLIIWKKSQISCMERYYYSWCLKNESKGCTDHVLKSISCYNFTIENFEITKSTEVLCKTLNESDFIGNSFRKINRNLKGILMLQFVSTNMLQNISKLNEYPNGKFSEKWQKYANRIKLKSVGRTGRVETNEDEASILQDFNVGKLVRLSETQAIPVNQSSFILQEESREIDRKQLTNFFTTLTPSNEVESKNLKISDGTSIDFNYANNSFAMNAGNATDEKDVHESSDSLRKYTLTLTNNYVLSELKLKNKPEWKPFHFDCKTEENEFNTTSCNDWAAAGYCESNKATRFLWCRKTCLCTGPSQS